MVWLVEIKTNFSVKAKLKILDFDIENRPLSYWVIDRPTAEITAIASCWSDDVGSMKVSLLGRDDPKQMLIDFVARYNEADMVVGHYIRRHDLPIVNGALMEYGLPLLLPKMTCDTKMDMYKKADIPASQEYLGDLFNLPIPKTHMSQNDWREANRLTVKGLEATERRVSTDVLQNIMLRKKMLSLGLLKAPRMWRG